MATLMVVCILQLLQSSLSDRRTRILVNDPAYNDQRISHLESLVQQLSSKVVSLETTVHQQTNTIHSMEQMTKERGAIYVRWGKDSCPNRTDVETIYTGFIGGSGYATKGGSSKYFCLPKDPKLSHITPSGYLNYMYGTEYQNNYLKAGAYDNDAPCSVCQSTKSSNILMIPARNVCYPGWKTEYSGNLVGNDRNYEAAYEYVCLDSDPSYLQGGQRDTGGAWMCPVLSNCGTLPCPPYSNGKAITCVVCSK